MDKIQKTQHLIYLTDLRLEQINRANLPLDLVKDVLELSIKTMCTQGNYGFSLEFETYIPNDVLYITFHCEDLSLEDMSILNEAWIEAMIEHDWQYDFNLVSRLSVNYRPSLVSDGQCHVN